MKDKKAYLKDLGLFLAANETQMSGEELAVHLNRNGYKTERETEYKPKGRGIYKLISETWSWIQNDLKEEHNANLFCQAFVDKEGNFPYQ